MDVIKYVQTALKLWIFDEKAAQEVKDNEYPILIGAMLIFVIGLFTSALTILQEIITQPPVEESLFAMLGLSLSYTSLILVIPLALLSVAFFIGFALWSHIWIKILGGKNGLKKTLESFLLFSTTSNIVGVTFTIIGFSIAVLIRNQFVSTIYDVLLAFIGLGILLWYIFVIVKSISIIHDMDIGKAILAGFIAVVSIFIGLFIIGFIIGIIVAIAIFS